MQQTVLEVKNLTKRYNATTTAVDNMSFSMHEGEILGFLGPNGAGKTTTIQMILDIITPTSGTIRIFDKDMVHHREQILNEVNFSSAYVSLPGNLRVWENLYTFARLYDVKNYQKKLAELMQTFEVSELRNRMSASLSSGQATRVHLIKALLNEPKLLFLDEPTASLDPDIADRTRKLLKKIQMEKGLSIFYTTHNMQEVEELCDRAIFINHGKIVTEGTPSELVKKYGLQDLNEVFIEIARKHA
ncbi:MAG: ABC transporter ATP-binding protein [bacterium]|nr:ABC transporter ATP-binding protein [bacterium]